MTTEHGTDFVVDVVRAASGSCSKVTESTWLISTGVLLDTYLLIILFKEGDQAYFRTSTGVLLQN